MRYELLKDINQALKSMRHNAKWKYEKKLKEFEEKYQADELTLEQLLSPEDKNILFQLEINYNRWVNAVIQFRSNEF